jgi:hypothetical protein
LQVVNAKMLEARAPFNFPFILEKKIFPFMTKLDRFGYDTPIPNELLVKGVVLPWHLRKGLRAFCLPHDYKLDDDNKSARNREHVDFEAIKNLKQSYILGRKRFKRYGLYTFASLEAYVFIFEMRKAIVAPDYSREALHPLLVGLRPSGKDLSFLMSVYTNEANPKVERVS